MKPPKAPYNTVMDCAKDTYKENAIFDKAKSPAPVILPTRSAGTLNERVGENRYRRKKRAAVKRKPSKSVTRFIP